MRTLSAEFKKIKMWGLCPNCSKFSFIYKIFNEKDKSLPLLILLKNIPTGSYAQCPKCYYKLAIFKADIDKIKNDYLEVNSASDTENSNVDIIKIDKLKSYSVADELLKWVKLKEDGHISEQEFDEARKKLLKRD